MTPALVTQAVHAVLMDSASRPSRLKTAARVVSSVVAPISRVLTAAATRPRSGKRQAMRASRADKRLRKMAEEAEEGRAHTLEEIASVMGITRERVRQIEMRALRTFRFRLSLILKGDGVTPDDIRAVLERGREF